MSRSNCCFNSAIYARRAQHKFHVPTFRIIHVNKRKKYCKKVDGIIWTQVSVVAIPERKAKNPSRAADKDSENFSGASCGIDVSWIFTGDWVYFHSEDLLWILRGILLRWCCLSRLGNIAMMDPRPSPSPSPWNLLLNLRGGRGRDRRDRRGRLHLDTGACYQAELRRRGGLAACGRTPGSRILGSVVAQLKAHLVEIEKCIQKEKTCLPSPWGRLM